MKYYRLTISEYVKTKVVPLGLPTVMCKSNVSKEDFQRMPEGLVVYYYYKDGVEITDILTEPTMMVSPSLKKIIALYNPDINSKSVKLFAMEDEISIAPEYWVLDLPELDCLSDEVKVLPNGTLEKLILRRSAIGQEDIFKVSGTLESYVIVSTAVVESILRRKLYGVGFQEVEVR